MLLCCYFVNIQTWKCNHAWYRPRVVTQALHTKESLSLLTSRKLPTFYFFLIIFFWFLLLSFFLFFSNSGVYPIKVAVIGYNAVYAS